MCESEKELVKKTDLSFYQIQLILQQVFKPKFYFFSYSAALLIVGL